MGNKTHGEFGVRAGKPPFMAKGIFWHSNRQAKLCGRHWPSILRGGSRWPCIHRRDRNRRE
jgi:hypothetical protein